MRTVAITEGQRREPILIGDAGEAIGPGRDRADVVHQDVDPSALSGSRDERLRALGRRQIHRDEGDLPGRLELTEVGTATSGTGHDVGTLGDQSTRHGKADPFAGAGDDRDLSAEVKVHQEFVPALQMV